MKNLFLKIKYFFHCLLPYTNDCDEDQICFDWGEEENQQYNKFVDEHFKECGVKTPWLCFKYENGVWQKKLICPFCKKEQFLVKKYLDY